MVPVVFEVRHEARYKDQINRPITEDLVGNVNVTALGIARHRRRHRTLRSSERISLRDSIAHVRRCAKAAMAPASLRSHLLAAVASRDNRMVTPMPYVVPLDGAPKTM